MEKRKKYDLTVRIKERVVIEESLFINGENVLSRDEAGTGQILFEKQKARFEFKVPLDTLVIQTRRDEVQHPFLEPLFHWAANVEKYSFGTDLGKNSIFFADNGSTESFIDPPGSIQRPQTVVERYVSGRERYGEKFEQGVLNDFRKIGYNCDAITADSSSASDIGFRLPEIIGKTPLYLSVKEHDLRGDTKQLEMSMGMYRALALLISINFAIFTAKNLVVIIDDIGEGLDFERATSLIKLLIEKCKSKKIQLIMATNDRFVMNQVDLKFWHIVHREGHTVRILDYENSKDNFEDFQVFGLSNFDFFSREMYLEEAP